MGEWHKYIKNKNEHKHCAAVHLKDFLYGTLNIYMYEHRERKNMTCYEMC
jgi:hypothetical protein